MPVIAATETQPACPVWDLMQRMLILPVRLRIGILKRLLLTGHEKRLRAPFYVRPQIINGSAQPDRIYLETRRQVIVSVRHGIIVKSVERQREHGQWAIMQFNQLPRGPKVVSPRVIASEFRQESLDQFFAGLLGVNTQDSRRQWMIQHRAVIR
ncbi:MAG TPA: hypothetical protein VGD78_02895 [Chthoniobacterales bacterium]